MIRRLTKVNTLTLCRTQVKAPFILKTISDFLAIECGAISSFLGVTRNNFKGKKGLQLEYESYEKMALLTMEEIAEQAFTNRTRIRKGAIVHRLGVGWLC